MLAAAGVLSGDGDGKFRPNDSLSRAELCKVVNMIFKYTEKDTTGFSDVSKDAWYYEQVLIAKKAGYIKGYEDGTFRANNKVTREQACVILARVTGLKDNGVYVEIKDEVAAWALPSVKLVVAHELMALEEGNTFRATQNITRGEFSHTHAGFVKGSSAGNAGVVSGGGSVGGGSVGGGAGGGVVSGDSNGNVTATASPSPSSSPSASSSPSPSSSPSATSSPTPSSTPTPTPTPTVAPTPTPSPTPTPTPDYATINETMVDRIDELSGALVNNWWIFSDTQLENIIEPIKYCLDGAREDARTNVITNAFIRKKYVNTINALSLYIDRMSDSDMTDFVENMSVVDEEAPGTLAWLFEQFGILDKVNEMLK